MSVEDGQQIQNYDLVIVGAGIYGIQAARTFLELHPSAKVAVLEASGSIGGVWSQERVYNDFWTQTPLGILEFSDQSMHDVPKSDSHYGFFRARHVVTYLERYCDDHVYSGSPLRSRIRLHTSVKEIHKQGTTWIIHSEGNGASEYRTTSIIIATGLTSDPQWPALPGRESFKGSLLHHKDFAKFETSPEASAAKTVVVIGGAKSAADVAYAFAKAAKRVTWIIRKSGSGPAAFASAKGFLGYGNSNEFFYTRIMSLFLVSLFSLGTRFSKILGWLNETRIGQALLRRVWQRINREARSEARYDRPEGKDNGFANLRPDTELFWQNDSTGVNQRVDFFDIISTRVNVVREDIVGMNIDGVVLADEVRTCIPADVVLCATGWKSSQSFLDERTAVTLGLPGDPKVLDKERLAHWQRLEKAGEADVLEKLPILDSSWAHEQTVSHDVDIQTLPYRMWRSIVPVQDSSILFLGQVMLGNHFRASEVQALFACAVLDGNVAMPSTSAMEIEVAKTVAWCRRRYLKKGSLGNWFYWDVVPYTDLLLAELGLESHRQRSWIKDLTRPSYAKDLRGLLGEYSHKHALSRDGARI